MMVFRLSGAFRPGNGVDQHVERHLGHEGRGQGYGGVILIRAGGGHDDDGSGPGASRFSADCDGGSLDYAATGRRPGLADGVGAGDPGWHLRRGNVTRT